MKHNCYPTLCAVLSLALGAVHAAATNTPPTALTNSASPAVTVPVDPSKDYRRHVLCPNDVVEMKVYRQPDLETRVRISIDGTVTMPLLGGVNLQGQTVEEARLHLRDLLAKDFLVNPQVSLAVVEYAKQYFTVLGEVQRPGTYEIPPEQPVNLLQAIAMAGGYTRLGAPGKVTVQRVENGQKRVHHLDSRSMAQDEKVELFEIQSGDTINIGERVF